MYVNVQPTLPELGANAVQARVTVLATSSGNTSVHWRLMTVPGEEMVAAGAVLRPSYQDAQRIAVEVLAEVLRVLPTLVDAPPFPEARASSGADLAG